MNKLKLTTLLFPLCLSINSVQAAPVRYQVELTLIDDTVFQGTFDYDIDTQEITNLQGILDDTLMGNIEPIRYQLKAEPDGKGGITAYAYSLNTTEIATNPPINNNVYVAINFNAQDPTLGVTDISQVAYMDCSAGGLMGNTCMYDLSWHNPVFPMDGGRGIRSEIITRADNPASYSDCLFHWAETTYASLFSPAQSAANSQSFPPYYFRFYKDQSAYLGISSADNHLYYLPAGGTLLDVGHVYDVLKLTECK
ncbi:MAG: hypothetical protein methR_P1503 [Methyloprofundus sp.]|nr:MAG: hypothetical protein methR_P1503 [Methyloprofundus sp.]